MPKTRKNGLYKGSSSKKSKKIKMNNSSEKSSTGLKNKLAGMTSYQSTSMFDQFGTKNTNSHSMMKDDVPLKR